MPSCHPAAEERKRSDRLQKRRLYQDEGVSEYWIVDLELRRVERWLPYPWKRPPVPRRTLPQELRPGPRQVFPRHLLAEPVVLVHPRIHVSGNPKHFAELPGERPDHDRRGVHILGPRQFLQALL